jgi:hypothetical protein
MARTFLTFQAAFDNACGVCGFTAAQVASNVELQAQLLRSFNLSYQVGYDLPGSGWEDARTGAVITPASRLIDYAVLGDAREFEVWDKDPRGGMDDGDDARRVAFTTDSRGILIRESTFATVWVAWMPEVVEFTTTGWVTATSYGVGDKVLMNGCNYRCLVGHTSGTFETDLSANKWLLLPVLGVMKVFLPMYMKGQNLIENGQPQTGYAMQGTARKDLEVLYVRELSREKGN